MSTIAVKVPWYGPDLSALVASFLTPPPPVDPDKEYALIEVDATNIAQAQALIKVIEDLLPKGGPITIAQVEEALADASPFLTGQLQLVAAELPQIVSIVQSKSMPGYVKGLVIASMLATLFSSGG